MKPILLLSCSLLANVNGLVAVGNPAQWTLGPSTDAVDTLHEVQKRLKAAEVIPTVIDDFVPKLMLHVDWPAHQHAALGNTLKPKNLADQPAFALYSVSHRSLDANLTYVVTITDPDAPSRENPEWSEFCHFIGAGELSPRVQSDGTASEYRNQLQFADGLKDVVSYKPPGPPPKTGKHRYVMLVFAPANGTTDALDLTKPSERKHWGYKDSHHGVRDWAAENGLEPVAANFIYAQNKKQ